MGDTEERPEKAFNNNFFQQNLKHYWTQVAPAPVVLCLCAIACVFIPVGAAIIVSSDGIFEVDVRYDKVRGPNGCTRLSNDGVASFTANGTVFPQGCTTNVKFRIEKDISAPIYIYYRLTPFYQNYRLYAKSKSENQGNGADYARADLSDCSPYIGPNSDATYAPCGMVAYSMFNDTISLYKVDQPDLVTINGALPSGSTAYCLGGSFRADSSQIDTTNKCTKKGIAFSSDIDTRFKATPSSSDSLWTGEGYANTNNSFHRNGWYDNEAGHSIPKIYDEDFMVWSRIATLSDFRKLYRKINVNLPQGNYVLRIDERFEAASIDVQKHVIIATTGWIGGANHVLGALYLAFGAISLVLAFGFIGMYMARNKE